MNEPNKEVFKELVEEAFPMYVWNQHDIFHASSEEEDCKLLFIVIIHHSKILSRGFTEWMQICAWCFYSVQLSARGNNSPVLLPLSLREGRGKKRKKERKKKRKKRG
jgi:hypothetical protein